MYSMVLLFPNFLVLFKELNGLIFTSKLWTVASEEIEIACAIKLHGNANKHLSLGITCLFAPCLNSQQITNEAGD